MHRMDSGQCHPKPASCLKVPNMHPFQVNATAAAYNAIDNEGPTVPGWYCADSGGWHGPFEDHAEAEQFCAYCERQDRAEMRHERSCRYPGV